MLLHMASLIDFVASWSEPICAPHRGEVHAAARQLALAVREADVDQESDLVREYVVLNYG